VNASQRRPSHLRRGGSQRARVHLDDAGTITSRPAIVQMTTPSWTMSSTGAILHQLQHIDNRVSHRRAGVPTVPQSKTSPRSPQMRHQSDE
jgi:hypothetical protein